MHILFRSPCRPFTLSPCHLIHPSLAVVTPVERKQKLFIVAHGFQMHGPRPDFVHVAQGIAGVVKAQIDAFVTVAQVQLTAITVIAVLHADERLPEIGHSEQLLLLDLLKLAGGELVQIGVAVVLEREHILFQR